MKRFRNDIRRIWFWKHHPPDDEENEVTYIPGLYLKSGWEPDPATKTIEKCMNLFESTLISERARYCKPSPSNLLPSQWNLIDDLQDNDVYISIEADKNLGGCLLLRNTYNTRGVSEHLGDSTVYKPLSKDEATSHHRRLRTKVEGFIRRWRACRQLSKAETVYLQRALEQNPDQFSRFRMSLKAHKTPWKMRPIVCCAGTFMNNLSCWLDYWLQKLKPSVPTYIKDSKHLLYLLKQLGILPPNARLFTADANSMYTNIDTDHAIEIITAWLKSIDLPDKFPLEAVLDAMELVMRNNLFNWGDMFFLQLLGTAMGTSAACMWATIYFAVHESECLIPKYNHCLLLFKRFIDDMFGIWIGSDAEWVEFQNDTNNFGILTWDFEEPSLSVDFLDLTISIEANTIVTTTFQKALNLYQYIPPHSAHPPKMIQGIIYGLLKNYYIQNTKKEDYHNITIKLYHRLVARGWNAADIKSHILAADTRIKNSNPPILPLQPPIIETTDEADDTKDTIFIHWEYHPNDIPRRRVRAIYNNTCGELLKEDLDICNTIIAYSRPPNLKDMITKAKLHQAPGKEASKYYSGELP